MTATSGTTVGTVIIMPCKGVAVTTARRAAAFWKPKIAAERIARKIPDIAHFQKVISKYFWSARPSRLPSRATI